HLIGPLNYTLFFSHSAPRQDLHSFPTRRSSDLFVFYGFKTALYGDVPVFDEEAAKLDRMLTHLEEDYKSITIVTHSKGGLLAMRSEEHTSELQSPYDLVCRLMLEKKIQTTNTKI